MVWAVYLRWQCGRYRFEQIDDMPDDWAKQMPLLLGPWVLAPEEVWGLVWREWEEPPVPCVMDNRWGYDWGETG